jgi:hypothetical protein
LQFTWFSKKRNDVNFVSKPIRGKRVTIRVINATQGVNQLGRQHVAERSRHNSLLTLQATQAAEMNA